MAGVICLGIGLALAFIGFDMHIALAIISGLLIAAGLQEIM